MSHRPRITVGGLWHETNTFASTLTSLDQFYAHQFAESEDLLTRFAGVRNEIGGFIRGAEMHSFELLPALYAAAVPSGIVERRAYDQLKRKLIEQLAYPSDGILLALHGAMVAEGVDDVEGDILRTLRDRVENRPIVATFDYHANISEDMVRNADVLIGYDTYPHIDAYDRAIEASQILSDILTGKRRPVCSFRKLPLLTAPQSQATDANPMRIILDQVRAAEGLSGIITVSAAAGYPYSDVRRLGFSILVYSDGDQELATRQADALTTAVWSVRHEFVSQSLTPSDAVRRAINSSVFPVILVDVADNIGGGSPGDGTVILSELLASNASGAVVTIVDPQSVAKAMEAGIGNQIEFCIGGKTDGRHGPPVPVRGTVRVVSDGFFVHGGSYMTGQCACMGNTIVLNTGGVEIVLMERPTMPFDAEQLRSLGINPADKRIIVVKSAVAWRAAYGDIARAVLSVDTPGICSSDLKSFDYRKAPRPIFPIDEI